MNKDIELLMKLQYDFPLSKTPFSDLGEGLGLNEEEVLRIIDKYFRNKVITRIGAQIDYRLFGRKYRALIGFKVDKEDIASAAELINRLEGVKHNYLRDGSKYNVWFTISSDSEEDIYKVVWRSAEKIGVEDYVILPTRRVYKLDVRYDLYKGISWSPPILQKTHISSLEELDIDFNLINDLIYHFNLVKRPFKLLSIKYDVKEDSILDIIEKLYSLGVMKFFGAQLNPEKISFKENAMIVLKIEDDKTKEICMSLVKKFSEITHCVERTADLVKWNFPIYFMIHSKERNMINSIIKSVSQLSGVIETKSLFSIVNLRRI